MALYHLSVKPVSRGAGRSAVAAAAYRMAEALHDARTGQAHDYTRKRGVEARILLVPQHGGVAAFEGEGWTAERERLWNAAEAAEKRKDARVAREYELALPCELDAAGRHRLVAAFGHELVGRYGVAVDAAIHAPGWEGDQRNWHAHVLATTRRATADGLGEKAGIELSDSTRGKLGLGKTADEIDAVRAAWGGLVNRALAQARAAERVDHRSYARQGRGEVVPMQHAGPAVSGLERKAERQRMQAEAREGLERVEAEAPTAVSEPVGGGRACPGAADPFRGPGWPWNRQGRGYKPRHGSAGPSRRAGAGAACVGFRGRFRGGSGAGDAGGAAQRRNPGAEPAGGGGANSGSAGAARGGRAGASGPGRGAVGAGTGAGVGGASGGGATGARAGSRAAAAGAGAGGGRAPGRTGTAGAGKIGGATAAGSRAVAAGTDAGTAGCGAGAVSRGVGRGGGGRAAGAGGGRGGTAARGGAGTAAEPGAKLGDVAQCQFATPSVRAALPDVIQSRSL